MLIAGVDVGNTTTEVVIIDSSKHPPELLAFDRVATRGLKGSAEAFRGAAELVRRIERRIGQRIDMVSAAPQFPVATRLASISEVAPDTGRLEVLSAGGDTPGGAGVAVGVPVLGTTQVQMFKEPIILFFPVGTGFQTIVASTKAWLAHGNQVKGLLLADDEGVLVSARLQTQLPVADQIDVARVAVATKVAMEIRPPGHALKELNDPVRLSYLLDLTELERKHALAVSETLGDSSRGLIVVHEETLVRTAAASVSELISDQQTDSDDVWMVALREVAASVAHRIDANTSRMVVIAALSSETSRKSSTDVLRDELNVELKLAQSEAVAARVGAFTTPGAQPGSLVADLGGGTIDVMGAVEGEVVLAGAGEMLTAGVSAFLQIPRGAAEWVKRGPSSRVEDPQILLAEDGIRTFLDSPAPTAILGSLVVPGPAGLLPFSRSLAPSSWRALRLRFKQRVIADNLARALERLDDKSPELLLVGGVAGDEELIGLLRNSLPGVVVGRCDVAGKLGHRYAVAYGLALLAI